MNNEANIVNNQYQKFFILFSVAIGSFLAGMDTSIINIAIPTISINLNTSIGMVANTLLAFWIVNISFLLIFAKVGDVKGRRTVFLWGFILLGIGSFLCGIAQNIDILIASRIVQGIGAAFLTSNGTAIICDFLPQERRGYYMGINSMATNMGMALGPSIGGFLITYFSWQSIFIINIPVIVIAIIAGAPAIPKAVSKVNDICFDIKGSILLCLSLSLIVYILSSLNIVELNVAYVACFLGSAVLVFLWFIQWELKCKNPLIDLSLFKSINFTAANLSSFFTFIIYSGAFLVLPIYLCVVKNMPVYKAGLIMMLLTLTMSVLSPLVGKLTDKFGSIVLCVPGAFLTIVSYIMFYFYQPDTNIDYIVISMLLFGLAMSLFFTANTQQVFCMVDTNQHGVAGGVLFTVRFLGAVLGVCLFQIFLTINTNVTVSSSSSLFFNLNANILIEGFKVVFAFGTVVCILTFICTLILLFRNRIEKVS